jgi:hypothetical protein
MDRELARLPVHDPVDLDAGAGRDPLLPALIGSRGAVGYCYD